MKKLTALLLALVMLCCGLAVAETATDVLGTWYATLYGMAVTLELNEDNTAAMLIPGMDEGSTEAVWEIEGNTIYLNRGQEDESLLLITEDGTLADPEGMLTFTREPVAAIETPELVSAADIADFNGTYMASMIDAFGMKLDIEAAMAEGLGSMLGIEDDLSIVIDNGSVAVFGGEADTYEFADGRLQLVFGDEELASLNQYVTLTADGGVAYEVMGMQIFFAKAE